MNNVLPINQQNLRATPLRLFPGRRASEPAPFVHTPPRHWQLRDVRALAIDPDVETRRAIALCPWVVDAHVQLVLASDPDEQVVLNLLKHVDPHAEACDVILTGPHRRARRELARRSLPTSVLLTLVDASDEVVRTEARNTLERRGVLPARDERGTE